MIYIPLTSFKKSVKFVIMVRHHRLALFTALFVVFASKLNLHVTMDAMTDISHFTFIDNLFLTKINFSLITSTCEMLHTSAI